VILKSETEVSCSEENLQTFILNYLMKELYNFRAFNTADFTIVDGKLYERKPVESSYNYHNNYYDKYETVELTEKQHLAPLVQYYKYLLNKNFKVGK